MSRSTPASISDAIVAVHGITGSPLSCASATSAGVV
jgi:hypothetical protein